MWNVCIHLFRLQFLTFCCYAALAALSMKMLSSYIFAASFLFVPPSFVQPSAHSIHTASSWIVNNKKKMPVHDCIIIIIRFDPGICILHSIVHYLFFYLFGFVCQLRVISGSNWIERLRFALCLLFCIYCVCDSFVIVFPVTLPWSMAHAFESNH